MLSHYETTFHNSHPVDLCPNPTPWRGARTPVQEPSMQQNPSILCARPSTRRYGYQAALYTNTDVECTAGSRREHRPRLSDRSIECNRPADDRTLCSTSAFR